MVEDEHEVTGRSFPFGYAQGCGSRAQDDRGGRPGQWHLNFKGVIEYKLKTGKAGMEARERRALESIFAQVEDRRMERTKRHRLRDIIIIAMPSVE